MSRPVIWDVRDVGCWADGAFGHAHIRAALADTLESLPVSNDVLTSALREPMSDDAWEEYSAIELLNAFCGGCRFEMIDGDLMLVEDSNEE